MKKMKVFTSVLCIIALIMGSSISSLAISEKKLTQEEIAEKFEIINASYEIGEPFSKEDAKFVKKYAKAVDNNTSQTDDVTIKGMKEWEFDASKTALGVKANCEGMMWSDINIINHSYGGDFTTTITSGGPVNSITNKISLTAYGVIGSSGIGLVYSGSLSSTGNNVSSWRIDEDETYTAAAAYIVISAKTTIATDDGSFSISHVDEN